MGKTFSTGLLTNGIWQDASNNIGIGAANSSFKFQVTGTTNLTGALSGTSATFSGSVTLATSSGVLAVNTTGRPSGVGGGDNGKIWSKQATTGNYGIATIASATDSFTYIGHNGTVALLGTSYGTTGAYTDLVLQTSDSERMRITSGGNVLIGTTTDYGYKTVVAGNNGLYVRGGSATSDTPILVQDNSGGTIFKVRAGDAFTQAIGVYNNTVGSGANVVVTSDGGLQRSTSSLKYKKNVENYSKGLADVMQLRPVTYNSKNENETQTYAGLIAEEVHELGLTEFVQYADDGTPDALSYSNMVALAFKAIQEQTEIITKQGQAIEELKALINK